MAFNAGGNIFRKTADSSDEPTPLLATPALEAATDWSLDGKYILYLYLRSGDANSGRELWYLRRKENGSDYESVRFLRTPVLLQ